MLMIAGLAIWFFAFAVLRATLQISYLHLLSTLSAAIRQGLGPGQLILAGILLAMIVAVPLVLWNLWEEWSTSYTVTDDKLIYRTTRGITLEYSWSMLKGIRPAEADGIPATVMVREDASRQIPNRFLRWLHRQVFGIRTIPIYSGVEDRDELLAEIARHSNTAA
jgi:hypothetical protein